jgi:hypothetical protein
MPIVHANGETAELIFTCTPNSAVLCWLQRARYRPPTPASGAGG